MSVHGTLQLNFPAHRLLNQLPEILDSFEGLWLLKRDGILECRAMSWIPQRQATFTVTNFWGARDERSQEAAFPFSRNTFQKPDCNQICGS